MSPQLHSVSNGSKNGAVLLGGREVALTLDRQTYALLTSMAKLYQSTTPLGLAHVLLHNAIHELAIQAAQERVAMNLCNLFACAVWR